MLLLPSEILIVVVSRLLNCPNLMLNLCSPVGTMIAVLGLPLVFAIKHLCDVGILGILEYLVAYGSCKSKIVVVLISFRILAVAVIFFFKFVCVIGVEGKIVLTVMRNVLKVLVS